jgi:pimeloyl-ACP methyl ester carboxylesterase
LIGTLAAWLASGCGGQRLRADDLAAAAAFTRTTVRGTQFMHVAYSAESSASQAPLWVYIEGDGVPWIDETIPSSDPTPRTLVALGMMARGPRPAVYLGRPCYFGTADRAPCEPVWWTHRRFSPEVAASMVTALRQLVVERGWAGRRINLVGFSGGGTLATLMAARLDGVCALITLASPLDIDEWTASRGYSPLAGSENPARLPPLPGGIRQLHLRGERDQVVSQNNGEEFRRRNPAAHFRVVGNVGHGVAWVDAWEGILRERADAAIAGCS